MKILKKQEPASLDDPAFAQRLGAIASRSKFETTFYELSKKGRPATAGAGRG